jgi:hypothetical protein
MICAFVIGSRRGAIGESRTDCMPPSTLGGLSRRDGLKRIVDNLLPLYPPARALVFVGNTATASDALCTVNAAARDSSGPAGHTCSIDHGAGRTWDNTSPKAWTLLSSNGTPYRDPVELISHIVSRAGESNACPVVVTNVDALSPTKT